METLSQPASLGFWHLIKTVAKKEFMDCLHSRWLIVTSGLFAFLAVAIAFGASAVGGEFKLMPLPQMLNSLLIMSVFLLPLLALLLSFDAFVGEAESGTLLLMLTYPLSRSQWLFGKLIGQGVALLLALILGFVILPLLLYFYERPYSMTELLYGLGRLIISGWLLGLTFLLIGYFVSLFSKQKAQAMALLLLVWVVIVLFYDLSLLVLTVAAADYVNKDTLQLLMLANPASVFRILNQEALGVAPTISASIQVLYGLLIAWITGLLFLCHVYFKRKVW